MISKNKAVMFGGFNAKLRQRTNDTYILDLENMVRHCIIIFTTLRLFHCILIHAPKYTSIDLIILIIVVICYVHSCHTDCTPDSNI